MASIMSKLARAGFAARAFPSAVGGFAGRVRPSSTITVSPSDAIRVSPAGGPSSEEERTGPNSEVLPQVDESVLESDEAMWAFYEQWCKFHGVSRDRREIARRFKIFSKTAREVYKFNNSGVNGSRAMTRFADWTKKESSVLLGYGEKDFSSF